MSICIRQEVPFIGRALRGATSVGSSVISWFGRMESCMALSIAEAKDVATFYLGGSKFLLNYYLIWLI